MVGVAVLQLAATDADKGPLTNELKFVSLENTTDFNISESGLISIAKTLDYENKKMYSLTAIVSDRGEPYLEQHALVDIFISNVNDVAPAFTKVVYTIRTSEKAPIGMVLVKLEAVDADSPILTYAYVGSGPLDSHFRLNGNELVLDQALDKDLGNQTYSLHFSVSDGVNSGNENAVVIINVVDVNDNQPVFDQGVYEVTVDENAVTSSPIVAVNARDNDTGNINNMLTYSIKSGLNSENFTITGNKIFAKSSFDYEKVNKYSFHIQAIDNSTTDKLVGIALIIVNVLDQNDNSPIPSQSVINLNVSEGTLVGSHIITVFATDADSSTNAEIIFQLTDSTFSITQTGEIKLKQQLDEFVKSDYNLTVIVSDGAIGSLKKTAVVQVNIKVIVVILPGISINNCPFTFSINESSVPTTFSRQLAISDSGSYTSKNVRYEFASGNKGGFTISSDGLIVISTSTNYETINRYDFLVKATNERGATAYCLVNANINDINEKPFFKHSQYSFNVSESVIPYTIVYSVDASDPDFLAGQTGEIKYSLVLSGDSVGMFSIDNDGRIRVISALNYEYVKEYSFTVSATDSGVPALSSSALINVTVLDWNDNRPTLQQISPLFQDENTNNSNIVQAIAADNDSVSNRNIEFVGIYPEGILSVNKVTGQISVEGNLDYESRQQYKLVLVAKDLGTPYLTTSQVITLNVGNKNDEKPTFLNHIHNISVSEKTDVGTVLYTVLATDADLGIPGNIATYVISSGNGANKFEINNKRSDYLEKYIANINCQSNHRVCVNNHCY